MPKAKTVTNNQSGTIHLYNYVPLTYCGRIMWHNDPNYIVKEVDPKKIDKSKLCKICRQFDFYLAE